MSRIIFSQAPHISVEYDSAHYIYANWKGYVDIHQVKDGTKRILDAIIHYQCDCLLNDNRELFGSWTQAIRAIERDSLPLMLSAGLKKIAFIYSRDASARYSVDRFLEVNDEYVGQTFEDFRLAENWLTEQITAEVRSGNPQVLAIRDHDRHLVLEISDIFYVFSKEGGSVIQTRHQIYSTRTTLKDLLKRLPPEQFMQIHRSYLINIREIATLKYYAGGSYHAFLKDMPKIKIPVSKQYASILKGRLGIN